MGQGTPGELSFADKADERRYEARAGSKVVGFMTYRQSDGLHTEVDPSVEGQGVGSELGAWALDDIRRRGLSVAETRRAEPIRRRSKNAARAGLICRPLDDLPLGATLRSPA
jgi:predicted GNAT family acetyltransferase